MKKIILASFLFIFLISPGITLAQCPAECPCAGGECDAGLVPCGKSCDDPETENCECCPCTFCHIFLLLNNLVKFIMFRAVPAIAVLMIVIGGAMFIFSGFSPELVNKAKSVLTSVAIGLLVIFGSWIIVNTVLNITGLVESESLLRWYEINCSI